jgi:ABC-type multidrug transport system fused ATPase/permease subunit
MKTGGLLIDDKDVMRIPLHELRRSLAIVPQEPILFRGSIKSNMDPFSEWSDSAVWAALEKVHMAVHVSNMPGASGLREGPLDDIIVAERGSNFSQGQKQLLCMARALLRYDSFMLNAKYQSSNYIVQRCQNLDIR